MKQKTKKKLKRNQIKYTLLYDVNNATAYICLIIVGFICILTIVLGYLFSSKRVVYASSYVEQTKDNQKRYENIELEEIDVLSTLNETTRQEIITEEVDLEYITKYENNSNLPSGSIQVTQEGRNGIQQVIIKKTYKGEEIIKEEITGTKIIKSSITKVVEVGTGSYQSNYTAKVNDTMYVTSSTLNMMANPDKASNKITTLKKKDEVTLLEKQKDWYKISYKTYVGYVDPNCLSVIDPNANIVENKDTTYSKTQLLNKLSKDMALNKPSGLTLEQFKKILSNDANDTNKVFEQSAEYFYYIEQQYKINGVFVAAVGIHESAWGTSSISQNKKNLFGYGASDSNPYNNAYSYTNYSESIDLIARVFCKYYLNPAGTTIYDGEIASGKYYNGATLSGVNKKYASDTNWANGVYKWMNYLYNKL